MEYLLNQSIEYYDKWEDNNVFGVDRSALQLDGGTF